MMDATGVLLETVAYRDLKVVDIAREAGTSPATFYQYFPDVEAAMLAMAAALGENLLVIHGWSDPLKVGPYRKQAWVWKSGKFFRAGDADPAVARGQGKLPDIAQINEIASQVREIAGLS